MRDRITVRMTNDMIARLDALIAAQPHYLSRQELVRRCVEFALEQPDALHGLACEGDGPLNAGDLALDEND
jgi:Arc/MetJ-type ribon-helix-helix transcriptional regulator